MRQLSTYAQMKWMKAVVGNPKECQQWEKPIPYILARWAKKVDSRQKCEAIMIDIIITLIHKV